LANLGNLFRAEAQLAGLAAGVTHIENPEAMAFPAGAFGTTAGVMEGAFEERAAHHVGEVSDTGYEFIPGIESALTCHHYR